MPSRRTIRQQAKLQPKAAPPKYPRPTPGVIKSNPDEVVGYTVVGGNSSAFDAATVPVTLGQQALQEQVDSPDAYKASQLSTQMGEYMRTRDKLTAQLAAGKLSQNAYNKLVADLGIPESVVAEGKLRQAALAKSSAVVNTYDPSAPPPTTPQYGRQEAPTLSGDDLKVIAAARRDERIRKMGVDPTSAVLTMLEQGGRFRQDYQTGGKLVMDMGNGNFVDVEGVDPSQAGALNANAGSITKEGVEKEVEEEYKKETPTPGTEKPKTPSTTTFAGGTIEGVGGTETPFGDEDSDLKGMLDKLFLEHPAMAAIYQPLVNALTNNDNAQATAYLQMLMSLDKSGDRAAQVATAAISAAKQFATDQLPYLKESRDIALDQAHEARQQAEYDKTIFALQSNFKIHQNVEQAAENELINRRTAAAYGFTTDTNGLRWMQREARLAQDTIAFMQTATSVTTSEMSRRLLSEHSLSTRAALYNYNSGLFKLQHDLDATLGEIENTLNAGDEQREQMSIAAYQKYLDSVAKRDEGLASVYKEANKTLYENSNKHLFSAKDTFEFEEKLVAAIRADPVLQDANGIVTAFGKIQAAKELFNDIKAREARGETVSYAGVQEAMVVSFQKILDPRSIVRESEFARTAEGQSAIDYVNGWLERWEKGGVGLGPQAIEQVFLTAERLKDSSMTQYAEHIQPFVNRIERYNAQNPALPIDIRSVMPVGIVPLTTDKIGIIDALDEMIRGTRSNPAAIVEHGSAGGMRTDRHNNPTAFTVDVAEDFGLVEGVDYVAGDPFDNDGDGRRDGVTALLLGDPIETTIRGIRSGGFYTATGARRWGGGIYAGVKFPTKSELRGWSDEKLTEFIADMYRREGGTELKTQFATSSITSYLPEAMFRWIPTAHAYSY